MKKLIILFILLTATPSFAEFTDEEKTIASRMGMMANDAMQLANLLGNEYFLNQGHERYDEGYPDTMRKCVLAAEEASWAAGAIAGSWRKDRPEDDDKSAVARKTRAIAHWTTVGVKYADCRDSVRVLTAVSTSDLPTKTENIFGFWDTNHGAILGSLNSLAFADAVPSEHPFFVRRASDGVGVHGDFEQATTEEAQGLGYLIEFNLHSLKIWRDNPYVATSETKIRNLLVFSTIAVDTLQKIQFLPYHYQPCNKRFSICPIQDAAFVFDKQIDPALDDFARLFKTLEIALDGRNATSGARMFSILGRGFVPDFYVTLGYSSDPGAAFALNLFSDAWNHAIDIWSWDASKFPCINGDGVSCIPPPAPPTPIPDPNIAVLENKILELEAALTAAKSSLESVITDIDVALEN